jgi:hypothetical protein
VSRDSHNLILGIATGYTARDIEPFVVSLRRSGFRGRCRIFVSPADADAHALLAKHGIEVGVVASMYARLWQMSRRLHLGHRATRGLESALLRALEPLSRSTAAGARRLYRELAPIHATGFRYLLYLEHLRDPGFLGVDRVFLADTRDLIFQRDPFDTVQPDHRITMFLEERSMTIGACLANSNWVRQCYGEPGLAAIADRPIFCSGTMLGDRDAMVTYLDALIREIAHAAGRRFVSPSGFDQACHNHLLYGTPPVPFVASENGAGVVMQLAHRPADRLAFSPDGELLNDDGAVVPVVHQWDRHAEAFRPMLDRLVA